MSRLKWEGFTTWELLPGRLYQRGQIRDIMQGGPGLALAHLNVKVVVGLAPATPDAGLAYLHERGLLEYVHAPIPDGKLAPATGAGLLMLAAAIARRARLEDFAVLAHCRAGRNRSGLFSALLLREWLGLSGADAMAWVRRERPRALDNDAFEAFLAGLPPLEVVEPAAPPAPAQTDLFT